MYTPNNPQVYTAAYAGCISGLAIAERSLTGTLASDYTTLAGVAGAYAQELDTQWGSAVAQSLEIQTIQSASEAAWSDRGGIAGAIGISTVAAVVLAVLAAGSAYYATNGLPNPPFGGANAYQFLDRVDCSVNNGRVENPFSAIPTFHTQPGGNVAGGFNGGGVGNKTILGFRVGNGLPLASLLTLEWTWKNINPSSPSPLEVYANLILDVNGDGSAYKVLSIDPASVPGLNNGTTVINGDGSRTTTWLGTENVLVVLGLPVPPLPPGGPGFVPPTVPGPPLPGGWPGNSYSIPAILAAYPAAKLTEASSGDGGLPKAPNVTPPFLLVTGDSANNSIQSFQVTNVRFNGVQV